MRPACFRLRDNAEVLMTISCLTASHVQTSSRKRSESSAKRSSTAVSSARVIIRVRPVSGDGGFVAVPNSSKIRR